MLTVKIVACNTFVGKNRTDMIATSYRKITIVSFRLSVSFRQVLSKVETHCRSDFEIRILHGL